MQEATGCMHACMPTFTNFHYLSLTFITHFHYQEATGCMHACPRNIRKQLSLSILGTTLYAGVYDFHLETFC